MALIEKLTAIADNIRTATGSTESMTLDDMANVNLSSEKPNQVIKFTEYDKDGFPTDYEWISNNITKIPNSLFSNGNGYLSKRMLFKPFPKTITYIGAYAFFKTFMNFNNGIIFPENLSTIEKDAFEYCTINGSIVFNEKINTIGQFAFSDIRGGDTSVVFKGNVPNLPNGVFYRNTIITLYDFSHATFVPSIATMATINYRNGCVIKIPSALADEWMNTTNWCALTNVVWQDENGNVLG